MIDLSPTTPWGFLLMETRRRVAHARANPDRGASTVEWVIITGVLVVLAGAIGVWIYNLVTSRADQIQLPDSPGGGGGGGGNP